MRNLRLTLVLVAGLVSVSASAVPSLVGYQGRVLDSQGTPVNGNVALGFALFAAAAGGSALWSETQSSVAVVDGVYSVNLGTVVPLDPSLLNGAERWLEVTVNGETMTPRQRFTSTPYALRAGALDGPILPNLEALRGLPCNVGTPGVGTTTLTYAQNGQGTVTLGCAPSQSFLLTVQQVGPQGISVSSNPVGIACNAPGSDCTETYPVYTTVVLTRAIASGCVVTWGGACAGAGGGTTCSVLMDAAKTATIGMNCI